MLRRGAGGGQGLRGAGSITAGGQKALLPGIPDPQQSRHRRICPKGHGDSQKPGGSAFRRLGADPRPRRAAGNLSGSRSKGDHAHRRHLSLRVQDPSIGGPSRGQRQVCGDRGGSRPSRGGGHHRLGGARLPYGGFSRGCCGGGIAAQRPAAHCGRPDHHHRGKISRLCGADQGVHGRCGGLLHHLPGHQRTPGGRQGPGSKIRSDGGDR